MLRADIDELGHLAFSTTVTPLKKLPECTAEYLGWDTEYNSKTGEFVCFQLWGSNGGELFTEPMTVDSLALAARRLGVTGHEVYLVSFFSIAEMQFLPVVEESSNWKLFGNGSLDATFFSYKAALTLNTFDIARFFDKSSLAKVAESFGMKKLDFNTKAVSKSSLRSRKFREYALHDARLCYELLGALRASLGGPDPLVHRTAPGCAAALFRAQYLTTPLRPPHPRYRLMAMLGSWGGRAEAYRRGDFPHLWEYDLTSAYPRAVLALGELPIHSSWSRASKNFRIGSSRRVRGGFFRVRFEFPQSVEYPCLPILARNVLLYPRKGETFCTLAELKAAYKLCARLRIIEGYTYSNGSKDLAAYMSAILSERQSAIGARKVALKLLANSLIGKLSQRVTGIDVEKLRKLAIETNVDLAKLARLTIHEARALGVDCDPKVGSLFYPEWNGLITGHVRARISELAAKYKAVYVATDAIWVTKPIPKAELPDDLTLKRHGPGVVARTRLGMIRAEGETHIAHHGVARRDAAIELLSGPLHRVIDYQQTRPNKLKESLRKGASYGEWQTYERQASADWDHKRKLNPDGSTSPWDDAGEFEEEKKAANRLRARQRKIRKQGGGIA